MLQSLPSRVSTYVEMQLHEKLQYPQQIKYGKTSELLPSLAVKLRLKSTLNPETAGLETFLSITPVRVRFISNSLCYKKLQVEYVV